MAKISAAMQWIVIKLIRGYQICISPMIGQRCRFTPTCSHYAIQAINSHGIAKGCWLAALRLIKCQPLSKGGYDPVPPCCAKKNKPNKRD